MDEQRMQAFTTRERRGERGFTIIELMVVVLIIGILISIGIPTFLGARKPANDRQAQTLARTGVLAARTVLADRDTYAGLTPADLKAVENTVDFVDETTLAQARLGQVSVASGTSGGDTYVIVASRSTSGDCFAMIDFGDVAPRYQRTGSVTCRADQLNATSGWSATW